MICPGSSFVFAAEDPAKVFSYFDTVFDTLHRLPIRFDLFVVFGIRHHSPFWDYCLTRLTGKPFRCYNVLAEPQSDLRIHLPDSMGTLLASIDKKHRKNIRRAIEHFRTSVNEFRLERITEAPQVEMFLDTMTMIAANSWQGKTFGLADKKTESQIKYWKEIADLGFLRSYILWADDKPIAYRLGYQYQNVYEGQVPGYDLAYADLSPGIVCLYYCLDDLMNEQPAKLYDFDFGTLGNKRLFANEEIESTIVFISGSAKGTALAFSQRFLNQCVFVAKKLLTKWGLADQIRQLLKKKK